MYCVHLPEAMSPLSSESARPAPLTAARRRPPLPAGDAPVPTRRTSLEAAALATLDKLNRGVVLLSSGGEVGFANRAARSMVSRSDGFALRAGRLEFADPAVQRRYLRFLEQARDSDGGSSLVLRVPRLRQQGAYRVLVSALETDAGATPTGYSVFVYEPDAGQRRLPAKVLAILYGLSPSEARLANELFAGRSVQEAATVLEITVNTARSALKRIFGKCGVRSQAELLQLLALGPRTV